MRISRQHQKSLVGVLLLTGSLVFPPLQSGFQRRTQPEEVPVDSETGSHWETPRPLLPRTDVYGTNILTTGPYQDHRVGRVRLFGSSPVFPDNQCGRMLSPTAFLFTPSTLLRILHRPRVWVVRRSLSGQPQYTSFWDLEVRESHGLVSKTFWEQPDSGLPTRDLLSPHLPSLWTPCPKVLRCLVVHLESVQV